MKILRQGKYADIRKIFVCENCGCVYETTENECTFIPEDCYACHFECGCPCCKTTQRNVPLTVAELIQGAKNESEIGEIVEKWHNNQLEW